MQAIGGAGSKCWLCKDTNGIVEHGGLECTSMRHAFLRSMPRKKQRGDYQHVVFPIVNGIANKTW